MRPGQAVPDCRWRWTKWSKTINMLVLVIFGVMRCIVLCESCQWSTVTMPVYWINMNESYNRRSEYENYLRSINVQHHKRIEAVNCRDPASYEYLLHVLSIYENSGCDFAVIASHLRAIAVAVADRRKYPQPYALITEDDIRFVYCIDFNRLIKDAPPDFGVLQIATSSNKQIERLWGNYLSSNNTNIWEMRNNNEMWSTQAYIINTNRVRKFLRHNNLTSHQNKLSYHLYPPATLKKYCNTSLDLDSNDFDRSRVSWSTAYAEWKSKPCAIVFPFYVETFLYESMQPAYIARSSLVVGSKLSINSTLHQNHVEYIHRAAFERIVDISREVVRRKNVPPWIQGLAHLE